jgi:hypothetical protein
MNVPTDLSQKEMCEWVCFDAMDTMNNWSANQGLQAKFIVGATDTYMKYPEDDVYPTEPINYVKLDHVPHYNQGWADLAKALRAGQFFVSTGEVLIKQWSVEGTGSQRSVVAISMDVPLVCRSRGGDGQGLADFSASELQAFGTKHFSILPDAAAKTGSASLRGTWR